MKTIYVKEKDAVRNWYLIDAADKPLGRVAVKAASLLRGKNKVTYTPNQEMGDFLVIINAEKVAVTGMKARDKMYYHHSGYVGGMKARNFEKTIERHPDEPLMTAIKGMLPKGPLGRKMLKNVKVYAGPEHPHAAQNPQILEI
ncbi:50S ribosomal protein L13 [Treponema sp. HNW]|uniref:50S ribosomal protein L13 n=1 Tax=Treponema sp. HNW TaxID=3116654 RepID=UPI003D0FCFAC